VTANSLTLALDFRERMKAVDFEWEGKVEAEILDALANLLGRRSAIIHFNNSVVRIHGNGSHRQTSVSDGLSFPLPSSNSHHGSCVFTSSAHSALRQSVTVQVPTAIHGTSLPAYGSAEYSDAIGSNAGSAIEAHNRIRSRCGDARMRSRPEERMRQAERDA
jgi:hypothetical protein